MHHYTFTTVNDALPALCRDLLQAPEVGSRNGRVQELTHVAITLEKPTLREVLLPSRKASYAAQIAETMWVLAGRDDVAWLSHYLPRAPEFSDNGETWSGAYGKRIRNWGGVDQLRHVVDLLKRDPLSRRAVINIYDPIKDTPGGKDVPCNDWLCFTDRLGVLELHVAVRSNDLIWGWSGINHFEWSALQEIVAGLLGIEPGPLHFSIASLHVYDKHWARAEKIAKDASALAGWDYSAKAATRVAFDARVVERDLDHFDDLVQKWFEVESMIRTGNPSAAAAVERFPEPMLQDWLRVILRWWGQLSPHMSPRAQTAYRIGAQKAVDERPAADGFVNYVTNLHNEKHAAYGDSWKRRGEQIGILANIARKVDRLGVDGGGDTALDTAVDLMVYLAKYQAWLEEPALSDGTARPNEIIRTYCDLHPSGRPEMVLEAELRQRFETIDPSDPGRVRIVRTMMVFATDLAKRLWHKKQNETRPWSGYESFAEGIAKMEDHSREGLRK